MKHHEREHDRTAPHRDDIKANDLLLPAHARHGQFFSEFHAVEDISLYFNWF